MAVTYDLVIGQTGSLSLAHPAFYGIGAYVVGISVTEYGVSFPLAFACAAVSTFAVAIAIGLPSFRLSDHSFAIGTLGFAWTLQLVAKNWIGLTNGPMCVTGVRPLDVHLGLIEFSTASPSGAYYGAFGLAAVICCLAGAINSSRIGRAFRAVRENETLAEMEGVNSLYYKLLAFGISAAFVGIAGGYYVTYSSLVCPTEMGYPYTITLLIIVYLGGVGSIRGVVSGAILFTVIPEMLRIAPEARLVIYGVLLLIVAIYLPDGLEGLLRKLGDELRKHAVTSETGR
jgi:ABC-type branched-subunit amino acid transport system permease subunit